MVHTWIAEISALREEETYRKYYERVPDFRKQKADQLRFPQDRAQSVGAWMLLEKMREQYGAEPDRVFNLSHSGSYVLCSISTEKEAKVGCDIETIKETRMRVARRFFLPSETAYIERQPSDGAEAEAFYRLWVLKESFMKAVRKGMGLDTRSFEIGFDEKDVPFLLKKPDLYPEEFYYREYLVAGVDARIAVCSTDGAFGEIHGERME